MKKLFTAFVFIMYSGPMLLLYGQQADTLKADDYFDLSLEEIMNIRITTASKSAESIKDAPAIVSVISARDIERFGARSLSEVLDRATNVYFNSGYTYRNNMVSIRGNVTAIANTNVLILVDGRPFRESLDNGMNAAIYSSFPLNRVERIEIIRGPGSVLYGTCALTGIINIITKNVSESAPVSASVSYGTFASKQAQVSGAADLGKLKFTGGVNYFDTDGWDFSAYGEPEIIIQPDNSITVAPPSKNTIKMYEKSFGSNANLVFGDFKLLTNYMHTKQANMGTLPSWLNKTAGGDDAALHFNTTIDRLLIDLGYDKEITSNWRATLNVTYNNMFKKKLYPSLSNFEDDGKSNDYLVELTNYVKPFQNMNLVIGGLTNTQTGNAKTYSKTASSENPLGYEPTNPFDKTAPRNESPYQIVKNYNQTWWSIYAQGDYTIGKHVKLIAGAQTNKVTGNDLYIAPRIGSIFYVNTSSGIKVLYGKAFRSPTQSERYGNNVPDIYPNADLKPETIGTFETQLFYTKSTFEVYLTYYNSLQTDIIRQSIDDSERIEVSFGPGLTFMVPTYLNGGRLRSQGVELETKTFVTNSFSLTTGFSYQTTLDDQGNKDDYGMPKLMLKAGATYSFPFGLQLGVFNSYYGKGGDTDRSYTQAVNPAVKAYNYLSANVQYKLGKNFIIGVYANNILDEKIYYPEYRARTVNSLPGRAGRAINGTLTFKL
jgi:outer membrane receptor for ferrienterochelin and colicin